MESLKKTLAAVCQELFKTKVEPELTRTDEQFGDYATNVALQLAAKLGKPPREVADAIAAKLQHPALAKVDVAGPGFINLTLPDQALIAVLDTIHKNPEAYGVNELYKAKTIVIEHTDPNPFKEFHIGHAYSNTIGECLGRLYQAAGAQVHQVSYHGDIGLHIAMAVWEMGRRIEWNPDRLEDLMKEFDVPTTSDDINRLKVFSGRYYAEGAKAYRDSTEAAGEIREINRKIYSNEDPVVAKIYQWGKERSFTYFNRIYEVLGVKFERQYLESQTGSIGLGIVNKYLATGIFERSDGAIVFKGEKLNLHTRVFVNGAGLPTYEAKELGLAFEKEKDYHFDKAIVITANEIDEYFKVLLAALELIDEDLAKRIQHISHGIVKLPSGKMSSRTGKIVSFSSLMATLIESYEKMYGSRSESQSQIILGAMKYEFLKHRIGGDIVFDINESISLEGKSGPYIQYAYVRALAILRKQEVGELSDAQFNKL